MATQEGKTNSKLRGPALDTFHARNYTPVDELKEIDGLYDAPANLNLPIVDVCRVVIMIFKGMTPKESQERLANLRGIYAVENHK